MKNYLTKQDMHILEAFLENNIPSIIKEQSIEDWDLMECYEELFNYSHSLLIGHKINLNINSIETGKAFVFNQKYKNILLELSSKNNNLDLRIHCYLSLAALSIIEKYAEVK